MADWYNLTQVNASSVWRLSQSVNELFMFQQLGNLILAVIFFVLFINFNHFNNNPKLNMMFASFAIAVFSVILKVFQLVPDFTPFFCWALFGVATMIAIFNQ